MNDEFHREDAGSFLFVQLHTSSLLSGLKTGAFYAVLRACFFNGSCVLVQLSRFDSHFANARIKTIVHAVRTGRGLT